MSDVAQILGLAPPAAAEAAAATPHGAAVTSELLDKLKPGGTPSSGARAKSGKQKKLSGMQREVLELLESTHRVNHSLYPSLSKLSLQQKWKQHKAPAVKWRRKPFRNPARTELAGESDTSGLTLTHWVKAHVDPSDYVFARFNVTCDVTSYSDAEYAHALAPHDDPQMKWTKDETDELLRLCARFDLRWIVIADRYNTHAAASGTTARSIEDIKYRYYEATRLLGEYRDRVAAQQATATAVAAEATATAAIKLEPTGATEPTVGDEAKPLAGTAVMTPASTTGAAAAVPVEPIKTAPAAPAVAPPAAPATTSDDQRYRFNVAYEKQRKRQLELAFTRSVEEESELRRLSDALKSAEAQLKKVAVKVDAKKRKELADVPFEIARALPTGVLLRSSLLALPQPKHAALSSKLVKKLALLLDELGVPARPMPTQASCELFDSLRKDAVGLLSVRKHVAAKLAEAQALRDRYKSLTGHDFQPVSTPVRRSERRGDASTGAAAGGAASGASGSSSSAATPAGPGGQGKALKHSEKAFRAATKRRGAGASPGVPSKRNKKVL